MEFRLATAFLLLQKEFLVFVTPMMDSFLLSAYFSHVHDFSGTPT
jgi:hypothetical protein